MARITVRVRGRREAERYINRVIGELQEPKGGLVKATNKVAEVFAKNYDSEGSMVGGWPDLAEMTQDIREEQGFPASHPILIRYGSLRAVAVDFFENTRREGKTSKGDNYSDETVTGSLNIRRNVATMQVGGSYKVRNQTGHPGGGWAPGGDVPPRPFWFVDRHTVAAARDGLKDWIEDEVLKG